MIQSGTSWKRQGLRTQELRAGLSHHDNPQVPCEPSVAVQTSVVLPAPFKGPRGVELPGNRSASTYPGKEFLGQAGSFSQTTLPLCHRCGGPCGGLHTCWGILPECQVLATPPRQDPLSSQMRRPRGHTAGRASMGTCLPAHQHSLSSSVLDRMAWGRGIGEPRSCLRGFEEE